MKCICNECGYWNPLARDFYRCRIGACPDLNRDKYEAESPKYKDVFPEFTERLRSRMEKGFAEYGDKSFDRPVNELLGEIEEEILDICGWSLILYSRIQRLK